jgi:hypothetical protein
MTQIENPHGSEFGRSEEPQGLGCTGRSVAPPSWAGKRRGRDLVRFQGEYLTPAQIYEDARAQSAAVTVCRSSGTVAALPTLDVVDISQWAEFSLLPETENPLHAKPLFLANGDDTAVLPCRSLGTTAPRITKKDPPKGLSSAHKKTAQALAWNVAYLGEKYGSEKLGFLTLTFADHVTCAREASRRFHSLATHVLKQRYQEYIRVLERQKNGRIHYHLLVVLDEDIKTGFDFDLVSKNDYSTAGKRIRLEWAYWRKTAPQYRFGRTELMPVKSNSDALAQYVGKYIGKHFNSRIEQDKGVRLVSYSSGARMASSRYSATTKYGTEWRQKLYQFVLLTRISRPQEPVNSFASLTRIYGPNWGYKFRDFIMGLPPADLTIPF